MGSSYVGGVGVDSFWNDRKRGAHQPWDSTCCVTQAFQLEEFIPQGGRTCDHRLEDSSAAPPVRAQAARLRGAGPSCGSPSWMEQSGSVSYSRQSPFSSENDGESGVHTCAKGPLHLHRCGPDSPAGPLSQGPGRRACCWEKRWAQADCSSLQDPSVPPEVCAICMCYLKIKKRTILRRACLFRV